MPPGLLGQHPFVLATSLTLLLPNRPSCSHADGKLLLASASQDKNVRVWAVQVQQPGHQPPNDSNANPSGAVEAATGAALLTRYAPKPLVRTDLHEYSATLEALLIGHEDWVHAVAWHPRVPCSSGGEGGGGGGTSQPACLLSASMDRTMMIWRPDPATGGFCTLAVRCPAEKPAPEAQGRRAVLPGAFLDVPCARTCRPALPRRLHPALFEAACAHPCCACCQNQRYSNAHAGLARPTVLPPWFVGWASRMGPSLARLHAQPPACLHIRIVWTTQVFSSGGSQVQLVAAAYQAISA